YYLTGFLHERPLARLREQLATLGIERAPEQPEPEDHAGVLLEIMAGLAGGTLPAPPGSDRALFEGHLAPWIGRFFTDLQHAEAASFYRAVGALGQIFIDIETEAFALPE
ncbi:MAG: molecular chaperone TorD family protein, partial [Alphaproteobacteria bacterium]|nr:molecular chaperone TorD family protein [Alphaproteobacteria bacterium]